MPPRITSDALTSGTSRSSIMKMRRPLGNTACSMFGALRSGRGGNVVGMGGRLTSSRKPVDALAYVGVVPSASSADSAAAPARPAA